MQFITLDKLREIEEREDVDRVENNGISGLDGSSLWLTIYYKNGTEKDVYIRE